MDNKVIDFHCDVLYKMALHPNLSFASEELDVTLGRMKEGGIMLQCFAIFLSDRLLGPPGMNLILDQIDIFEQKVITKGITPVYSVEDLDALSGTSRRGGLLSLEGADGLEGSLDYLRLCFDRGVRFLGLTWNYANWAADGILEQRNQGFTPQGIELVKTCHQLGIILDVSHLSHRGFWELAGMAEAAGKPFIASHSNAYSVCSHARNLTDDQIKAIIKLGGRIGITYVPWFIKSGRDVSSMDILPHIDRICSLGGAEYMMFGSDFDGIESHLSDFQHAGHYAHWVETLLKHYPEGLVWGWLHNNADSFLRKWLPPSKKAL